MLLDFKGCRQSVLKGLMCKPTSFQRWINKHFPHFLPPNILLGYKNNIIFKDAETASAHLPGPEQDTVGPEQALSQIPNLE